MANVGLVLVKSNADLEQEDRERAEAEDQAESLDAVESGLTGHIHRSWQAARDHKREVEKRMLASLRQINGQYSQEKLQQIQEEGGTAIYMQLTAVKCRAAKSWIRDILMPAGDRPWTLEPTPVADLPEDVEAQVARRVQHDAMEFMQRHQVQLSPEHVQEVAKRFRGEVQQMLQEKAELRAERMADQIEDQLVEGGWNREFDRVISDLVDYPAGIMKAPVIRRQRRLSWDGNELVASEDPAPEVERVDPFMFYPAPGITDPEEGDCMEVHEYTRTDLHDMIGLDGFDEDAIRRVLDRHRLNGTGSWLERPLRHQIQQANKEGTSLRDDDFIEVLEWWGEVPGKLLIQWGMDPEQVPDEEKPYPIAAWLSGGEVLGVQWNPDPLGKKPYKVAHFQPIQGAFWGQGLPELIEDCQAICNAAARSLVNNMAISSGPQVGLNISSIPPGEDVESMYPWKIWQLDFTKTGASSRPPIDFYQPQALTHELMSVFDKFSRLADEHSGIPGYTYGDSDVGGAGRTASGLSMLMNAASKSIKSVIANIDSGVISPVVYAFWVHNMLFNPDQSLKGDDRVVAQGALSLVAKEQVQMRRQEFLQMTANPMDAEIMGKQGRAALLRELVKGLDVSPDDVVPDREELQQRLMQQAMQPGGGQPGAPGPGGPPQDPQQGAPAPPRQSREMDPAGNPVGGRIA